MPHVQEYINLRTLASSYKHIVRIRSTRLMGRDLATFYMELAKVPLLTPFIAMRLANETPDISNYGLLYGTIPTSRSVFVYATNYDVLSNTIAGTTTACTFIASCSGAKSLPA